MANEAWRLPEKEWDVTERLRVAAWIGRSGARVGVEGLNLEEQPESLSVAEAKRLVRRLETAIAWAEKERA